jgi:hypothetical protein
VRGGKRGETREGKEASSKRSKRRESRGETRDAKGERREGRRKARVESREVRGKRQEAKGERDSTDLMRSNALTPNVILCPLRVYCQVRALSRAGWREESTVSRQSNNDGPT